MSYNDRTTCVCCDLTEPEHSGAPPLGATQSRRRFLAAAATTVGVAVTGVAGPLAGQAAAHPNLRQASAAVVIANRGSGDVTVINADTLWPVTVPLPGAAEPMYANHDSRNGRVLVGDRGSSTIVALDDSNYSIVGTVAVGDGIFHQWLDNSRGRLWVVGTAASTVTVVDTNNLVALDTFAIPSDLVERGGVTHDVFVEGAHAFVSVLGLDDGSGAVLQYSTRTLELTGRITTGGDPHLFVRNGTLYVPAQDSSTLSTYVAATLRPIAQTDLPNAHGIFVTRRNEVYVTNIAQGGVDALWSLAGRNLRRTSGPIDTAIAVPHNVAVTKSGIAFVTHSGAQANAVSVINPRTGRSTTVTAGTNPFGLTVVE